MRDTYLEGFQHRHFIDEVLVHFALLVRGFQQDTPEGLPVHGPECAGRDGLDGGCPGHVVEEGQFPESPAIVVSVNESVHPGGVLHVDLELPPETRDVTDEDSRK